MSNSLSLETGRLGRITGKQLQAALDRFGLGRLESAAAVPFGLFGQNAFVDSDDGSFVLRFGAHYDWQFPTEKFFCNLIHEHSDIPVPWPYQWEPSSKVFGYPWGYVLMPRLPGVATADSEVYGRLPQSDKEGIAHALAQSLQRLHRVRNSRSGSFDHNTGAIEPFRVSYVQRSIDRIAENIDAAATNDAMTADDRAWIEEEVNAISDRGDNFDPVLVHGDFNTNNTAFERGDDGWQLSGLFDLMTAHFGDALADVPRQFNMYVEDDAKLAATFLTNYLRPGLRADEAARLRLYHLDERLIVWEFFHRPDHIHQWRDRHDITFRRWYTPYRRALDDGLTPAG